MRHISRIPFVLYMGVYNFAQNKVKCIHVQIADVLISQPQNIIVFKKKICRPKKNAKKEGLSTKKSLNFVWFSFCSSSQFYNFFNVGL